MGLERAKPWEPGCRAPGLRESRGRACSSGHRRRIAVNTARDRARFVGETVGCSCSQGRAALLLRSAARGGQAALPCKRLEAASGNRDGEAEVEHEGARRGPGFRVWGQRDCLTACRWVPMMPGPFVERPVHRGRGEAEHEQSPVEEVQEPA